MSLSVEAFLRIEKLSGISVLAGRGGLSSRFITACSVIDAPNAQQWVKGGELFITSGYLFVDTPLELLPVIEGLARGGAAAIAIKVGRYITQLPGEVLALADRLDFPLLNIPSCMNFSDILTPVITTVANQQFDAVRQLRDIQDTLLGCVVKGGQIGDILDRFESFSGCPVRLLQDDSEEVFESKGFVNAGQQSGERGRTEILSLEDKRVGTLEFLTGHEPQGEVAQIALAQTKIIVTILIRMNLALWDAERRRGEEFLQDLLFRRGAPAEGCDARAKLLGWKHRGPVEVALIKHINRGADGHAPRTEDVERFARVCARVARSRIERALCTDLSGCFALILPVDAAAGTSRRNVEAVESIRLEIETSLGFPLIAALGSAKQGLATINESYSEARETLDIMERIRKTGTVRWEELSLDRILVILRGTEAGHKLVQRCLGPLLEADTKYQSKPTSLLRTLEVLIHCNWHLKETAIELSIHYNTLKYRLEIIDRLIGQDLEDSRNRMELSLALALYRLDNSTTEQLAI